MAFRAPNLHSRRRWSWSFPRDVRGKDTQFPSQAVGGGQFHGSAFSSCLILGNAIPQENGYIKALQAWQSEMIFLVDDTLCTHTSLNTGKAGQGQFTGRTFLNKKNGVY